MRTIQPALIAVVPKRCSTGESLFIPVIPINHDHLALVLFSHFLVAVVRRKANDDVVYLM